jgi:hypothetical protein
MGGDADADDPGLAVQHPAGERPMIWHWALAAVLLASLAVIG